MPDPIPFNKPCLVGTELANMAEAVRHGHISAKGPFTERAAAILRETHDAADVLLTSSCTDALEMSAMLLGLGPGDVVIVPSFTFSSTATAFARTGARLRFCDIALPHLGLDPDHVAASMGPEVRAIVTVHYAGVASDVERLRAIADEWGVPLVEDNAHGLFATHRGRTLGTFGRMAALSFHETKNFICGEGGALVLNDPADVGAAHVLLDKGTNRRQFLEGQVDKYTWQGAGSSFGMSDLLAAFLVAQLEARAQISAARHRVWTAYRDSLAPHAERLGVALPYQPGDAVPADHMFYVLLPSATVRPGVIAAMRADGIHPTFHYVPLHSAPAAAHLADRFQPCPVTDDVSSRLLRLPFYNDLSDADVDRVVTSFLGAVESTLAGARP